MNEVSYRFPPLSRQFDNYLRATVIPYELVTDKQAEQMLIQIDPLDIPLDSPMPKKILDAEVIHFVD
jgi:hypothetical protein